MSLLNETLLITSVMFVFFLLPRFIQRVESVSRYLLLIGTGGLLGFFFFDLVPDVIREGGTKSAVLIVATGLVYSVLQRLPGFSHGHKHESSHEHETLGPHAHRPGLLFGAMLVHCVSSGMVMALSGDAVFGAMISHKAYEALSVSLVLQIQRRYWGMVFSTALAYAGAFPLGVWVARAALQSDWSQHLPGGMTLDGVVLGIACLAVGSILGCLIHDFLIPTFLRLRTHPKESIWLIIGLLATLLVAHGH